MCVWNDWCSSCRSWHLVTSFAFSFITWNTWCCLVFDCFELQKPPTNTSVCSSMLSAFTVVLLLWSRRCRLMLSVYAAWKAPSSIPLQVSTSKMLDMAAFFEILLASAISERRHPFFSFFKRWSRFSLSNPHDYGRHYCGYSVGELVGPKASLSHETSPSMPCSWHAVSFLKWKACPLFRCPTAFWRINSQDQRSGEMKTPATHKVIRNNSLCRPKCFSLWPSPGSCSGVQTIPFSPVQRTSFMKSGSLCSQR